MATLKPEKISRLFPSRWHRIYTIAKLRSDPLYNAVYNELEGSQLPLLDIGCGLGILAFYLRERDQLFPIKAIDYDQRKIIAAKNAARNHLSLDFIHGDIRDGLPDFSGNITILDILQFFSPKEQATLLRNAALSVARGGKLIIRSGISDNSLRFKTTRLGDRIAKATFWMKAAPTCYPEVHSIVKIMEQSGLRGEAHPLWGKTPFNNYLMVFNRD
ncbi:MAG: class I SAM-dependent methyltransferase [Verrucomicrobiaceae bacterium]|nr:class I SAM-dependent methyltransferase [Verrucomicrobiaceae bacterium]